MPSTGQRSRLRRQPHACSTCQAPTNGIVILEDQRRFGGDVSASHNGWFYASFTWLYLPTKGAPGGALLGKPFAGFQLVPGIEAGHLCARARPTGRPVVGAPRTEDEIF